jgi:hypothetical protein
VLLGLLDQQKKVMSMQRDRHFDSVVLIQIEFDQRPLEVVGLIMAVADSAIFPGKKLGSVFVDVFHPVTDLIQGVFEEIKPRQAHPIPYPEIHDLIGQLEQSALVQTRAEVEDIAALSTCQADRVC